MSNFYRPPIKRKSRKQHTCISCGYKIENKELYIEQTGFWEEKRFRNKFHQECFDDLCNCDSNEFEFTPYSGEPPERLITSI